MKRALLGFVGVVVVAATAALAGDAVAHFFTGGAAPLVVGTTPRAQLLAAPCAECHAEIVQQWRGSRHAVSWTNSTFQSEYAQRPRQWCVNCHAPFESADTHDVAVAADGISCAVCHIREGRIHSAEKRAKSPHNTVVEKGYGGPQWCGSCHEFSFPRFDVDGEFAAYTNHPMQKTVSEHAAGPSRGVECRGCHTDHAFAGAHTPAMLQRALRVAWCRDDDGVAVTVANVGAGHNVPTGDVHRHLALRVWRSSSPAQLFDAYLGRRFKPDPTGGNVTVFDGSVPPRTAHVFRVNAADLGGDADEAVNVEVRYVFVVDDIDRPAPGLTEPRWAPVFADRSRVDALRDCKSDDSGEMANLESRVDPAPR